jgi:hypothetical protein
MNAEQIDPQEPGFFGRIQIVRLVKPRQGAEPSIGVIILGFGLDDLMAASRFARHGWLALQIRLISEIGHHGMSGVSRCREAMDYLTRKHGVQRFVMMGNCSLANICLNTALSDTRVVGLILTNLYVPEHLLAWIFLRIRRHLFKPKSWLRLLRGEMQVQRLDPDEPQLRNYRDDVVLPRNLPRCLLQLALERGTRILIAFSRLEPGLFHFRQYRKAFRESATHGELRFEVLPTDGHDFSATEEAATKRNDLISDWIKFSWSSEIGQSRNPGGKATYARNRP